MASNKINQKVKDTVEYSPPTDEDALDLDEEIYVPDFDPKYDDPMSGLNEFDLANLKALEGDEEGIGSTALTTGWLQDLAEQLDPDKIEEAAVWKPFPGPQHDAFYCEADELFYGGAAGGGKFTAYNTLILTPFGWKKSQNIKVGDTLVACDGTATKVLAVYQHKNKDLYKFTFADGATVTVSDDHLWAYWKSGIKIKTDRQYLLYSPEKGIHTEYTRHKLDLSKNLYKYHQQQVEKQKNGGRPYWILMPLCEPVVFTRPSRTRQGDVIRIDPYLLGLLIGDGSITDNGLKITTKDIEIVNSVKTISNESISWDDDKTVNFIGEYKKELQKQLESYGLWNHKANDKFIPDNYLFASLDVRFDLMAGLIDTDGYIDERGHISYCTISEQLAKDVQHLARSLGCKATITEKQPTYTHNGEKLEGQLAYNVWIQGGDQLKRFSKLPRKRDNIKPFNGGASEVGRRVADIEYVGKGDGVCFAIDHPQGLHIVQDFIVTHNTDLMLGLAISELSPHKKAICFRRTFPEHKDFIDRARRLLARTGADYKGGNQQRFINLPGNKSLELGSVPHFGAAQKYKGRPHDLKLFDEVSDMDESSYTFLIAWARTDDPDVPVRVVAGGNPPTSNTGLWVIRRWAPWLDPEHTNPARPGELRWFANLDGEDTEITPEISKLGAQGKEFEYESKTGEKETIKPTSRTFIPARVQDNPVYMKTDYVSTLQSLKEPLRSQLLYGDFGIILRPDPWQVIPLSWINHSIHEWKRAYDEGKLTGVRNMNPAFGLDVAEAGADNTAMTKITAAYVQWIQLLSATDTMEQVDEVIRFMAMAKRAPIGVDAIGIGIGLASRLRQLNMTVLGIKGNKSTKRRTIDKQFGFMNLSSELWWKLRERLNPESENPLYIPDIPRLKRELTAPTWALRGEKIEVQQRFKIKEKLGHSPDMAKSLMYAMFVQQVSATPLRML